MDSAGSPGGSRKRKLDPLTLQQHSFSRKRSATACQLCRTRKTKCDNQLPACSKCSELSAQCVYIGQANTESPAAQILERLEYLINLVETGKSSVSETIRDEIIADQNASESKGPPSLGRSPVPLDQDMRSEITNDLNGTDRAVPPSPSSNAGKLASSAYHEHFGSSEDILEWPIFQGRYDRRWIEARIFDPTLPCDDLYGTTHTPSFSDEITPSKCGVARQNSSTGPGVREEDVSHLVEVFLVNVHVKNPIFDPEYLRRMARTVVEDGFDWKAPSCLVLIVCALASISTEFIRLPAGRNSSQVDSDHSLVNTSGYYTAESYYTAACKRVGLLNNNLLATECYFMFGVYEMYSLRPLQAAISFNRACVTFQTLIWMNPEYQITESLLSKARASRLYWSCLKSEHEVAVEFRFPSSGLTKLNYTSHFPPPPLATNAEQLYRMHANASPDTPRSTSSASGQNELEIGWYYYLADIAARRILQRVIQYFYETDESVWLAKSFQDLLHTAEELDRQLTEWYRTLPSVISSHIDTPSDDELAFHLQARAIEIKERIYRPFLYLIIHKDMDTAERDSLRSLVQLHATTCSRLIRQWNVRHRHHGTWLMVRQSFACSLLLLAARKAGIQEVLDNQLEESVQASLNTLRYWEGEAPDLKASRLILEDVMQQMHG